MLVKSLRNTKVETINGKREVKEGEIFECTKSVYNGLMTCYKNSFEFLSLYVVFKSKQEIKGIEYKKGELLEVSFKRFNNIKSFYKNAFIFVDTIELYEKHVGKLEKIEDKKGPSKKELKESILKIAEENDNLELEVITKEIKNLNKEKTIEYLESIIDITENLNKNEENDNIEENDNSKSDEIENNDITEVNNNKTSENEENDTLINKTDESVDNINENQENINNNE